ncbi:MAG: flagellar biosynthesis protein FlhF [Desulfovibrionales bacterium]|nr:flagellar biosynthesis protein FlhF [Desulfovibrionales bacterium]
MQVKTFTGNSTKEIMARIKEELGPEAIILSSTKHSRRNGANYEIMAALDDPAQVPPAEKPLATTHSDDLRDLREEWSRLRNQVMSVLKPQMDLGLLTPRQQIVLEYLEREGVRQDVLMDLWTRFRRGPHESTLSVLSGMISATPWLTQNWRHKFHFLAGPYGSGKTSIALRLSLAVKKNRSETRIMVVNADRSQGKGRLYLRHYSELSGLTYRELVNIEQWGSLAREAETHDLVLVDLPGLPGTENMSAWLNRMSCGTLPPVHMHLVLSPLFGAAQMDNFVSRMRTDSTASIIWTKVDEACNYGEILNQARITGLPVSLLSVGPDLKNSLVQPTDQDIWKLLLRHELPAATN